jgi:hypothetical protein
VSEFKIGKISATNMTVGDHNKLIVGDLARSVQANADTVQQIEATLAQLQAEMASPQPRQKRIRELLTTLGSGAGALTAMVEGIERVRQAVGQ